MIFDVFDILVVEFLRWFVGRFLIDFWSIWGSKIDQKSIKNQSKKWSKIRCDFGSILDGSWTDFSSILGPSWGASWGQVGTKIWKMGAPRRCQQTYTKMMLKKSCRVARWCAVVCGVVQPGGGSVPTINQSNSPTVMGIGTLHNVPQGHGGGYIYIYMYLFIEIRKMNFNISLYIDLYLYLYSNIYI